MVTERVWGLASSEGPTNARWEAGGTGTADTNDVSAAADLLYAVIRSKMFLGQLSVG